MESQYPEIGVCGLSCRLCPAWHRKTRSRCPGCKTEYRMGAACSILRCAAKAGLEFCGHCEQHEGCPKWTKLREMGKIMDSIKCYQTLEDDIAFMEKNGLARFRKTQEKRELLLNEMLEDFDEGRSKSYYCVVATVLTIDELKAALKKARAISEGGDPREKAKILHSALDDIAERNSYCLRLRKKASI
jgi:hypothetical protein